MRNVPLSYLATIAGSLSIAVGLVVVSYGHIRKFAIEAGAAAWEAAVIAVTVDSLVVLSIAAIGHARGVGHKPPAMAKAALLVGVVATTGANLHHGWEHGWMGIVVSLWVPVAAELAYQLAMSAVRIGPDGGHTVTPPAICGGHLVAVSAVMVRVTAGREAAVAAAEQEAAVVAARPVICGRTVPLTALAATLPVAAPDVRPVICGAVIAVATLADTTPARPELPVICGGQLLGADTLTAHLTVATAEEKPVICGHLVAVSAVTAPVVDDRPVICGRAVSVAEVLARTPVAVAEDDRPAIPAARPAGGRRPVTAAVTAAREEAVMEWLTDPAAPDARMAAATGADIAALLAARDLGKVSIRTGRRILAAARESLGERELATA